MSRAGDKTASSGVTQEITAFAIERLAQVVRRLLWQKTNRYGLSPVQVQAILWLARQDSQRRRPSLLARALGLTPATVSEMLGALERKRLLSRRPDPDDRRSQLLVLTSRGRSVAAELADWATIFERVLDGMDPALRVQGAAFLIELLSGLHREGLLEEMHLCIECEHFNAEWRPGSAKPYRCNLTGRHFALNGVVADCPGHAPKKTPSQPGKRKRAKGGAE